MIIATVITLLIFMIMISSDLMSYGLYYRYKKDVDSVAHTCASIARKKGK